jgi:hypothetical protein
LLVVHNDYDEDDENEDITREDLRWQIEFCSERLGSIQLAAFF